jgi:1-acyl-sn-glycerol-3-phosphate acyltransferase
MPGLLRWVFNLLFALLTQRRLEGTENLPASGPYILTSNHLGRIDAPLIYALFGGRDLTGWAAEKYEHHWFFGTLLRLGGGIFIRRGEVDRQALSAAEAWLRSGKIFGMAPEGTRSKTGAMIRAKTGAAYLAQQTGVPIVPLAITGTEKAVQDLLHLRRPRLTIRVGLPFTLSAVPDDDRSAGLRRNTDEIMCRIAAMLPPQYHGVYADHPRLKELLAEAPLSS